MTVAGANTVLTRKFIQVAYRQHAYRPEICIRYWEGILLIVQLQPSVYMSLFLMLCD